MASADRDTDLAPPEASTLSERAARLVEHDILAGHLAPGSRLGIVDLVRRYEIGATPLREALSRLMSRGLITGVGQRGFRVVGLSREDLEDITRMRIAVEIEALRLSMQLPTQATGLRVVVAVVVQQVTLLLRQMEVMAARIPALMVLTARAAVVAMALIP